MHIYIKIFISSYIYLCFVALFRGFILDLSHMFIYQYNYLFTLIFIYTYICFNIYLHKYLNTNIFN